MESSAQSYARAFPVQLDKAIGAQLWDSNNNRYLDFLAGCGSLNYGHNHPQLKRDLIDYISDDRIAHGLDLHTEAKADFLTTFKDLILTPRNLEYVMQFTGPTGTNSVEAAFKLARKVTGRSNIICFTNGFHGVSLGALAATGNSYHRNAAELPLAGTTRLPYDGYLGAHIDTLDMFAQMLDDPSSGVDHPAAVIVECVQGEGGLNCASRSWLVRLERICRARDILIIIDDIQAGCGRTGTFFSFEQSGIKPDMVTMAKSLSGFGLPLSVLLIDPAIDIWKPAEHNGTFRGNNHAFVTATSALKRFWADDKFVEEIAGKASLMKNMLEQLADDHKDAIDCVKGRGMMVGLRCNDSKDAEKIVKLCFEYGLIIERAGPHDEVIKCMPPLTASHGEICEGLEIIGRACAMVFSKPEQSAPVHIPLKNVVERVATTDLENN